MNGKEWMLMVFINFLCISTILGCDACLEMRRDDDSHGQWLYDSQFYQTLR